MKALFQEFLLKTLTSRKFWATVTASMPFLMSGDFQNFSIIWMSYAGILGVVDGLEGLGAKKAEKQNLSPPSRISDEVLD